jgi:hypothetical protein
MLKRLAVILAATLAVSACGKDSDKAAPATRTPVLQTSGAGQPLPPPQTASAAGMPLPPSAQMPATTATNVPASRWSAVLVAGDNNSPAFDNGVESLREKLAQRGVQQIKVLSSNPSRAAAGQMASSGNVRAAIRGMAGAQACLAFVTTHGETKGFFLRSDRRFVEPSALDAALAAGCGNLPTVMIVSACHSGTFMTPEMRKPNRIILAAAAKDRTSFGCGARDLYTYYDQCLLQSFDQAQTWADLAAATRSCVENLERTLAIKASSEPQTFIGSSVANLRLPSR